MFTSKDVTLKMVMMLSLQYIALLPLSLPSFIHSIKKARTLLDFPSPCNLKKRETTSKGVLVQKVRVILGKDGLEKSSANGFPGLAGNI